MTCFVTSSGITVCQMVTKDMVVWTINNDFFLNVSFIFIPFEDCFPLFLKLYSMLQFPFWAFPFLFLSHRSDMLKAVLSGTQ